MCFLRRSFSVLPDLQPSGRGEYEITDAIQMLIDRGNTVLASEYTDDWFDTGTLPSFLETTRFLTGGSSKIDAGASVQGEQEGMVVVGEGGTVSCGKIVDSVILPGANVKVSGTISGCLLGGDVTVDGDISDEIRYGGVE